MHRGYIKLWRKLEDNPICTKPNYLAVWIYLLRKANHSDKEIIWNNKKVKIERGSFIGSMRQIADYYELSVSTVKYIIDYLVVERMIEHLPNRRFSLFRIINWEDYQGIERQIVNKQKTNKKQIKTTNNNKNKKNEKKREVIPPSLSEVREYIAKKNYVVDAEQWYAFYESKDWMIGKNKMKSWKAALVTWHTRNKPKEESLEDKAHNMVREAIAKYGDNDGAYDSARSKFTRETGIKEAGLLKYKGIFKL